MPSKAEKKEISANALTLFVVLVMAVLIIVGIAPEFTGATTAVGFSGISIEGVISALLIIAALALGAVYLKKK